MSLKNQPHSILNLRGSSFFAATSVFEVLYFTTSSLYECMEAFSITTLTPSFCSGKPIFVKIHHNQLVTAGKLPVTLVLKLQATWFAICEPFWQEHKSYWHLVMWSAICSHCFLTDTITHVLTCCVSWDLLKIVSSLFFFSIKYRVRFTFHINLSIPVWLCKLTFVS